MKRRVLHVINSMKPGGAEVLLANSLSPGGLNDHTDNWLVYFTGHSHLVDIIDHKVNRVCLDYKGGLDLVRVIRQLNGIIKTNKIDIIHSHLTPSNIYTNIARPANVKQVHTIHTTYSMDTETRPFFRLLEKQLYFKNKENSIICLSDFTKEDFLRSISFKGKTFVLNNFVADRFFDNTGYRFDAEKRVLRLVAAGSLRKLKNFEYLLEIFSDLVNEDIYLDIYGDGNKESYERVINERKLKVRMMGPCHDMPSVLMDYDIFIMPSVFEGFPLALFEAMASGIPVMLSDIPPLESIVKENGIYFELNNAKATAEMIRAVFNGEININTLSVKGKQYAEQTVRRDVYCKKLLSIYDGLYSSTAEI